MIPPARESSGQELLLRAAFLRGPGALEAWRRWTHDHDLLEADLGHDSARLLPLVYRNLVEHGADEPLLPRLKGVHRYWWCANHALLRRAALLLERLHSDGIPTLMLGGVATALLHYPDVGLRPTARIDVLVPVATAAAATRCLQGLGWRPVDRLTDEAIRYGNATTLVDDGAHRLGLHWRAFATCVGEQADEGLWQRSVPLQILGAPSRAMGPTDALLHTVTVGATSNGTTSEVQWIPDALAIVQAAGAEIDWPLLAQEARARRVLLAFRRRLAYLRRTFDAPLLNGEIEPLHAFPPSSFERARSFARAMGTDATGHALLLVIDYLEGGAGTSARRTLTELPAFLRYQLRHRREPEVRALRRIARVARWLLPGVAAGTGPS